MITVLFSLILNAHAQKLATPIPFVEAGRTYALQCPKGVECADELCVSSITPEVSTPPNSPPILKLHVQLGFEWVAQKLPDEKDEQCKVTSRSELQEQSGSAVLVQTSLETCGKKLTEDSRQDTLTLRPREIEYRLDRVLRPGSKSSKASTRKLLACKWILKANPQGSPSR